MNALLSLRIIMIFGERLCKALFPNTIVLLLAAWWNRKAFSVNSSFWFLSLAAAGTITMRFLYYMMGYSRYSNRYLYTFVVMATVFAVPGFFKIVEMITARSKWSRQAVFSGFVVVICLGTLSKALHYKGDKAHFVEAGAMVKELCGDSKRVLISDVNDSNRLAYYAGSMKGIELSDKTPVAMVALAAKHAGKGRVFLLRSLSNADFSEQFRQSNIPNAFELIQEFKDRKKRHYSLYEYKP